MVALGAAEDIVMRLAGREKYVRNTFFLFVVPVLLHGSVVHNSA